MSDHGEPYNADDLEATRQTLSEEWIENYDHPTEQAVTARWVATVDLWMKRADDATIVLGGLAQAIGVEEAAKHSAAAKSAVEHWQSRIAAAAHERDALRIERDRAQRYLNDAEAEIARLKARQPDSLRAATIRAEAAEARVRTLTEVGTRAEAERNAAEAEVVRLTAERDEYAERLQTVRNLREAAEARVRELEAVDRALPQWEPEPGSEVGCVGRVQTILNLKADRAERDRLRGAIKQVLDDAVEVETGAMEVGRYAILNLRDAVLAAPSAEQEEKDYSTARRWGWPR